MTELNAHTLSPSDPLVIASLLLPLFSFLTALVISERYSWAVALISTFIMLVDVIIITIVLLNYWNTPGVLTGIDWFSLGEANFSANLKVGNTSLLMSFIVITISFLVHLYSIGYMAGDMHGRKYFSLLGFFTFSMLGIVLADSLLVIFVFWELVGFSSYMLIGHYMEKDAAARASGKAFLMNRLGDAGFIVGMMIVWANQGTLELSELLITGESTDGWKTAASLCLFCGVAGKSAQFPLFTWLPDAMEGPTPVSALIHAATMVAAGVYLMTRIFMLFTPASLEVVAIVGAVTSLVGALAALTHFDMKKILAYSTVSQLGFMMMAIGTGAVDAALMHLFAHAFFKGCLFLCAGSVIHALHLARQRSHTHFDVQDIRNAGGLSKNLPITGIAFVISGASLAGIPFFSGFLSKEAIISSVWGNSDPLSVFVLAMVAVTSFLTTIYTFRLVWFTFFAQPRHPYELPVTESPLVMRIPVVLLAAGSLWLPVSLNPFNFTGWIMPAPAFSPTLPMTFFSIGLVVAALTLSRILFRKGPIRTQEVMANAFYFDRIFLASFKRTIVPLSRSTAYIDNKVLDTTIHVNVFAQVTLAHVINWIDDNIVDGVVRLFTNSLKLIGSFVRSFQTGKIQLYIFWALFAIIIFLIWGLN